MPTAELNPLASAELNPLASAKPPGSAPATRGLPSAPDAALVQRMREGDERSFETIFKRHQAPLLSYCRHMLGSQDEAEDALQQTFIKAHRALLGGSGPRELRPWLYAIARNCCLTAIAARRPTAQLEDRTSTLDGLSEDVYRREDLRELLAGIGRLPEDQRSALLLAELEDLPHRTIATIVGCEVSKVKALIYQARSSLIADRDARDASCREIREQLSVAHGGELRRGPLRRHLRLCEGCRDFQLAVSTQRESFAAVLPVMPSAGLATAILGHAAAHVGGVAGLGGVGGLGGAGGLGGTGGLASAGGAGATGAGGGGGIGGLTAAGTATSAAVGASAGGGTSVGALIGGGLVTKLAVGGVVVAMAAAGAVTVHNRETGALSRRTILARPTAAERIGRDRRVDIADPNSDPSSSFTRGSPTSLLALANTTGATVPAGAESLAELTVLGGADPLSSATGTLVPSTATLSADPGRLGGASGQSKSGSASASRAIRKARARHHQARARRRAALRRRQELLHRKAARLSRLRAARLRAQRKAIHRKHPPIKPTVKPPVTPAPAPARPPRRKTHLAPTHANGTTTPAGSTTAGSTTGGASKGRRRSPETAGTGASSTGAATGTAGTTTGKPGSTTTGGGETEATNPVKGKGSGKARGPGSGQGIEGTSESSPTKTKTGSGAASATGKGSTSGTSGAGKSGEIAGGASETAGASKTTGTGEGTRAAPKKHLVEEGQLPNL
jgi:RNA polymerase sigma factor (sigma-70 family)